jgi:membrane-associated protease RseP (regulator of RpoE activity)
MDEQSKGEIMKLLRFLGWFVVIAAAALVVVAVPVLAQNRSELGRQDRGLRELTVLAGRGAEIGVRITDRTEGGVVVEDVQPDSPAEKAGIKRSDVITDFDGERVRSARQFERLVRETAPGRRVKATITREGQRRDVEITPSEGRDAAMIFDGDRMRERLGDLAGRFPDLNFNFDFDMPGSLSGRRLGVTVDELSHQLAEYFGTKDGVLVTNVTEGSAAARGVESRRRDHVDQRQPRRVARRSDAWTARGDQRSRDDWNRAGQERELAEGDDRAAAQAGPRPARVAG